MQTLTMPRKLEILKQPRWKNKRENIGGKSMGDCKIIAVHSPTHGCGQTLLSNMIGVNLAERQKNLTIGKTELVLLLELDRYYASSNIIQRRIMPTHESLKALLERANTLKSNISRSVYSENMYFAAQPQQASIVDLLSYNGEGIDDIITIAKDIFSYIIIDIPADVQDIAATRIFNNSFSHNIYRVIKVLTEDIKTYKLLKDIDDMYNKIIDRTYDTDIIVNRSTRLYADYLDKEFRNLNVFKVKNVYDLVEVPNMWMYMNEGTIHDIGDTRLTREFFSELDTIADSIRNNTTGNGINIEKEVSLENDKIKGSNIIFKSKTKEVKEKSLYTKAEESVLRVHEDGKDKKKKGFSLGKKKENGAEQEVPKKKNRKSLFGKRSKRTDEDEVYTQDIQEMGDIQDEGMQEEQGVTKEKKSLFGKRKPKGEQQKGKRRLFSKK